MNFVAIVVLSIIALGTCQFNQRNVSREFGKMYFYNSTLVDFSDTRALCAKNGATPIQPRSRAEIDYIDEWLGKNSQYWVGVQTARRNYPTHFLDGSKIEWIQNYGAMAGGYVTSNTRYDCTSFVKLNGHSSHWGAYPCSYKHSVVCELSLKSAFPVIQQAFFKAAQYHRQQVADREQKLAQLNQENDRMSTKITEQIAEINRINLELINVHRDEALDFLTNITRFMN